MTKKKQARECKRAPDAAALEACEGMGLRPGGRINGMDHTEGTNEMDQDEDVNYVWAVAKWKEWLRNRDVRRDLASRADRAVDSLAMAIRNLGVKDGKVTALEVSNMATELGPVLIDGGWQQAYDATN